MLCEGFSAILIEEELRIGKTCPQHALVAVCHDIKMCLPTVAHRNKGGQETAVRGLDGEIALMVAHWRNHRLGGERQILFLERAAECSRILHEIEYLLEEVGRDLRRAATRLCRLCDLFTDHGAPPLGIDDDIRLLARRLVVRRRRDYKVRRGERPMPARVIPARHSGKGKGHDLCPVECHEPANRADESEVQIPPAHTVWQRNRTHKVRQERGQKLGRRCTALMHGGIDIAVTLNEGGRIDALSARKPRARLRRVSVRIKGNGDGWAARLRIDVFLPLCEARHNEGGTARRAERAHLLIGKAVLLQHRLCQLRQILQEVRHHMCRNLLRSNFK